ncbi:hypothetical protein GCM10010507_43390 [Streptomyces cinnamoneus]|uniref:Uncharacterized protein n=1 Tax=Streptomyces cinnamoneus TaxID=53446 RepID=A0A918TTV3_STRCJ|nr:hypothetical protein GCM10010507_43390 [Streptomyces cinnamoneus]
MQRFVARGRREAQVTRAALASAGRVRRDNRAQAPELGGGVRCRARGAHLYAAARPNRAGSSPKARADGDVQSARQKIATGATGAPTPPTKGSGMAASRKA